MFKIELRVLFKMIYHGIKQMIALITKFKSAFHEIVEPDYHCGSDNGNECG
jgi:hypothetical protein